MNVRLDSVVFETGDLARLRRFYVDTMGLRVGSYVKDGKTVPDEDARYFNLNVGGTLLGFETGETQPGTVVLKVHDLAAAAIELASRGIEPVKQTAAFLIIHDPDGRELILEHE